MGKWTPFFTKERGKVYGSGYAYTYYSFWWNFHTRRNSKKSKISWNESIAITDHDTIDGLEEGKRTAAEIGIEFIQGIEISCNVDN